MRRRLAHNRSVKKLRRRLAVLRATHRWRPGHIRLAQSGSVVYVDPKDPRGWQIVLGLGRGHQPALIALWRKVTALADADLVIDVGANYGEFTLSGSYRAGTRVIAIEPNPAVAEYLRRSIADHQNADQIERHEVIVSDRGGVETELRIHPEWSGSASVALDGDDLASVTVPTQTLDQLCPEVTASMSIVLKIDVEGWERHVISGASTAIGRAGSVTAIVEFAPDHLRRADTDPAALFARLLTVGPCHSVSWEGDIEAVQACPDTVTDLLVTSNPAVARWLDAQQRTHDHRR